MGKGVLGRKEVGRQSEIGGRRENEREKKKECKKEGKEREREKKER